MILAIERNQIQKQLMLVSTVQDIGRVEIAFTANQKAEDKGLQNI